ncbi:lamin tail domain-containing protein [Dehalococcoidia bacterium]|nr:lamin tail domain-containing protein [Dehalococcoidia bacterium]
MGYNQHEMKLKAIPLVLLLATLMLLLAACGGTSEPTLVPPTAIAPPSPTPMSTPTQLAPTPTPATKSTPSTPTLIPSTAAQQSSSSGLTLKIIEIATNLPDYNRNDWKHWTDDDSDCQNTRHEVLIEESSKEVAFKTDKRCQAGTGEWLDPYTGITITDATTLDVDHMVPLKNAHDSGGWAWEKDRKAAFANEMGYADHLIAVTASANRKKGAKGPEQWKPSNRDYWCNYAIDWVQIKVTWELSVTKAEWVALQEMLKTCASPTSITAIPAKTESQPATESTIPSTTVTSGSPNMQITSIDCKSKPEIVVIENTGDASQDLTGWKVEDNGPKYTFNFPVSFSLEPGSSVKLISGESGNDSNKTIYWSGRVVWNNDGDTASLFDPSGQLMSEMKCP